MMRMTLLVVCALAAGCLQIDASSSDSSSSSFLSQCINKVCRTCVDGNCTGPLENLRQEAKKQHEDVNIHRTFDLSAGLAETTFVFWVDPNGTGKVSMQVVDPVAGETAVLPRACFAWQRHTGYASSQGQTGSCGGAGNVAVSINGPAKHTVVDWKSLEPGQLVLTVSAPSQTNNLLVDIVVDNP